MQRAEVHAAVSLKTGKDHSAHMPKLKLLRNQIDTHTHIRRSCTSSSAGSCQILSTLRIAPELLETLGAVRAQQQQQAIVAASPGTSPC